VPGEGGFVSAAVEAVDVIADPSLPVVNGPPPLPPELRAGRAGLNAPGEGPSLGAIAGPGAVVASPLTPLR